MLPGTANLHPANGSYLASGATAAKSSTLPDMIVRTCSVMCSSGQSHQASANKRSTSASSYRRRMSLAGLPPTMP